MIDSPTLSWILTAVFAATGLWSLIRCVRSLAGAPVPGITDRVSCATCAVMSASMISMCWSWGMNVPAWPQMVVFALATVWFVALAGSPGLRSRLRQPVSGRLPHIHNALMMAAVVWMIIAMPASMALGDGAPPTMAATMIDLPVGTTGLAMVSALLAAYFLLAALPWLLRAVDTARTTRTHAYDAISHAAMSLGMGAMLLVMI